MKKALIALAIVCVASFVQAAACSWKTYVYATDMTVLEGGTYWLVELGTSADGIDDLIVHTDGTTNWGGYTEVDTGVIPNLDETYGQLVRKLEGLSSAKNGSYYAFIVWDGKTNGYYGVSYGQVDGIVDDPPLDANTITFDNSGQGYGATFANKATVTIPEPTVLALLALGVAGLALKRKNA